MSGHVDQDVEIGSTLNPPKAQKMPRGERVYSVDSWQPIIEAIQNRRHPKEDVIKADEGELLRARTRHQPPQLELPGFGEPLDDCRKYIVESMRYCVQCGDPKEYPRNCYRYDCPDHAPYAIRRRAAGSNCGSGIAPQLDALIRWLGAYRGEPHDYSHMVVSPDPNDLDVFESERPLEAFKEICRETLDHLGLQGALIYHPYRGDHEEPGEDDMGKWKGRLQPHAPPHEEVVDELTYSPHMHMIVVHPRRGIDLSKVGELYDETGWVISRITEEDSNVSIDSWNRHRLRSIDRQIQTDTSTRRLARIFSVSASPFPREDVPWVTTIR